MDIQAVMQWLGVLDQIVSRGGAAFDAIKGVLAAHGIEVDTAALDSVIADAARRKALAEREATGTAAAADLGVHAGSTGE